MKTIHRWFQMMMINSFFLSFSSFFFVRFRLMKIHDQFNWNKLNIGNRNHLNLNASSITIISKKSLWRWISIRIQRRCSISWILTDDESACVSSILDLEEILDERRIEYKYKKFFFKCIRKGVGEYLIVSYSDCDIRCSFQFIVFLDFISIHFKFEIKFN